MKEKKNPQKSIIYFYVATLITVLVLNTFVLPLIFKQEISQVDYSTFLAQIEKGSVKTVEIQENQIAFTEANGAGEDNIL